MKKLFYSCLLALPLSTLGQSFLPAIERFSSKKLDYLILNSGEKVEFYLDDLDRKKGLIVNVEGKTVDGKKFEYNADEIKEMYLAASDFAKLSSLNRSTRSVLSMQRTDMKEIGREHVYFEQHQVEGRKSTTLLQLVNPESTSRMKVFHDPWAVETMGVGIGGLQLTGGIDKSYYAVYDGKTVKIYKRNYEELFAALFAGCPAVLQKYKSAAWRDLPLHLDTYETECAGK
jgi:hypothetical protein